MENALKVVEFLEKQPLVEKSKSSIRFRRSGAAEIIQKNISRTAAVPFSHLKSKAMTKKRRSLSIIYSYSPYLPM